uniref:SPEF1 protein n=1 Tax=Latimeria chalumnae TaxID=7897 RepID=M3XGX9_LATCH
CSTVITGGFCSPLLSRKVFSKLHFHVPEEVVKKLISSTPGVIEPVLCTLRQKIEEKLQGNRNREKANLYPQDLEYYSIVADRPLEDPSQNIVTSYGKKAPNQPLPEWIHRQSKRPEHSFNQYAGLEPEVRLLLEEKEQALLALQETVEILQLKVNRLEHLVQLKDLRIEDLTRHLQKYKARGNVK